MTIQIPNVGTGFPADQTGDSPWLATKKLGENFSDTSHAASRLIGTSNGNVVEQTANGMAGLGYGATALPIAEGDLNTHSEKTWLFKGQNLENAPSVAVGWYYYDTQVHSASHAIQFAHHITSAISNVRRKIGGSWGEWRSLNADIAAFDNSHAASKLVGTASGQIPLAQDVASTLTGKAIDVTGVKSGAASYKRGWRKIVATFGTGDSLIYVPKGTNGVTLTQVRVRLSSNIIIHPSDNRPPFAYQVTENMNQQRVQISKLATATALDNAEIHVYIDEEL